MTGREEKRFRLGLTPRTPSVAAARLVGYSCLILFLELALIRYIPGYVRVFGFYLNFVLIATFLGMGVGLLRADDEARTRWLAVPAALLLFGAVSYFSNVVIRIPVDRDELLWGVFFEIPQSVRRIGILPAVILLFACSASLFVPLGAALGREFPKHPPLTAYSLNVVGSLAGVLAFSVASLLNAPPTIWFAVAFGLWCLLALPAARFSLTLLAVGTAAVVWAHRTAGPEVELWSPYYRIGVYRTPDAYSVNVNGSFHQYVLNLAPEGPGEHRYAGAVRGDYLRPFAMVPRIDTALVLGAGTGNDVALLLERGVRYVDAVEIDPMIVALGAALHFQHPYDDPRVHVTVTDARAFLRTTPHHYDVIVLGTLDSQTLLSGMSSLRLDNYVYTVEAFAAMRDRLQPDGRLVTYHMSQQPYVAAKILGVMARAFGRDPVVLHEPDFRLFNYTFVVGPTWGADPDSVAAALPTDVALPHDDWPYLYLRRHTLPAHYLKALAAVLAVAGLMVTWGARRHLAAGFDGTMFFLGAGFLLVETKSVSEMSLLFGATWVVNVLVFTSILLVILLANILVLSRPATRLDRALVGLFVALGVAFAVPTRSLLALGTLGQWTAGAGLVGLPVFFSSWMFAILFRDHPAPSRALAYNILGATVGGVLEYSSMVFGIKALYLVAALMYGAAALWLRRPPAPALTPSGT